MAEESNNWVTTCNRYVAFLDIMGFKDRVFRESLSDIYDMLRALYQNAVQFTKPSILIKPVIFSDSIVLFSRDNSKQAAMDLINVIKRILYWAMRYETPLKGALAYGEQVVDDEHFIYFGIPLIDAFELQNELLLYGVVLHHTMEKRLAHLEILNKPEISAVKYDVTIKKVGNITHYLVDWTYRTAPDVQYLLDLVKRFYNNVSGPPRIYVDNTLKFVRRVTEKEAELKKSKLDQD